MSDLIWRHIGAWSGGTWHSVALAPPAAKSQLALAASDAGLFRSADGGRRWARARGLAYTALRVVTCATGAARMAFAASQNGDLFRSAADGGSWQRVHSWAFGAINALALSPNYAQDQALFAATADGIFRSLDGGATWQSASFGLLDAEVLCLACAPDFETSEVVWAGSAAGGLYRSRNAGRAWRESGEGLADHAVQCIAPGAHASALFAGTEGGGVFRSTGGEIWETCGLEGLHVNCLTAASGAVLAGTNAGLFLSEDDGQSWQCALAGDVVLTVAAAPNGIVVAGCLTSGGLTSIDGGRTWQISTRGPAAHVPPLVAQSPDGTLFMFDVVGGAARSTDGGVSWADILFDHSPIQCVAAGGSTERPRVWAGTAREVLRWQAGANTFEPCAQQPALSDNDAISALAVTRDGTLLVGIHAGTIAISVDEGTVWHGLAIPGTGSVSAVHLTPSGGLFVLRLTPASDATFNADVWHLQALVLPAVRTADDWHRVAALDALRVPLACMTIGTVSDGERVVLAGQNVVAVVTLADGQARTATLPAGTTVTSLVTAHGRLCVATNRGVYVSADDGLTWAPMASGLVDVPIVALSIDGHGWQAITLGGDLWRCDGSG